MCDGERVRNDADNASLLNLGEAQGCLSRLPQPRLVFLTRPLLSGWGISGCRAGSVTVNFKQLTQVTLNLWPASLGQGSNIDEGIPPLQSPLGSALAKLGCRRLLFCLAFIL